MDLLYGREARNRLRAARVPWCQRTTITEGGSFLRARARPRVWSSGLRIPELRLEPMLNPALGGDVWVSEATRQAPDALAERCSK